MDSQSRKLSKEQLEEIKVRLVGAGEGQRAEELYGHIAALEEQLKDLLEACQMVVEVDDRAARYAATRACKAAIKKVAPERTERGAGRG